jgi:hypothetical protein
MLAIVLIESDVTEHGITKIQSDVTIIASAGRQNRDNPDNRQTGLPARLAISAIIVTGACGIARVSKNSDELSLYDSMRTYGFASAGRRPAVALPLSI